MQDKNTDKDVYAGSEDLSVKAEEYLEVITTEDERIKIIGEELANDTGRAIFSKISQGIASSNDLAKALNVSLPLINWHINRLLSVGLVKVEKIERSSKNKEMKFYGAVKTALVIIPPEALTTNSTNQKTRKESVLIKLRQYIASFVALAASIPTIYAIQKAQNNVVNTVLPKAEMPETAMKSTESLRSAAPTMGAATIPPQPPITNEPTMIIIALLGGAVIALCVFFITRFYLKRKNRISEKRKIQSSK